MYDPANPPLFIHGTIYIGHHVLLGGAFQERDRRVVYYLNGQPIIPQTSFIGTARNKLIYAASHWNKAMIAIWGSFTWAPSALIHHLESNFSLDVRAACAAGEKVTGYLYLMHAR